MPTLSLVLQANSNRPRANVVSSFPVLLPSTLQYTLVTNIQIMCPVKLPAKGLVLELKLSIAALQTKPHLPQSMSIAFFFATVFYTSQQSSEMETGNEAGIPHAQFHSRVSPEVIDSVAQPPTKPGGALGRGSIGVGGHHKHTDTPARALDRRR